MAFELWPLRSPHIRFFCLSHISGVGPTVNDAEAEKDLPQPQANKIRILLLATNSVFVL